MAATKAAAPARQEKDIMGPRFYQRAGAPIDRRERDHSRIKSKLRIYAIDAVIIGSGDSYASCRCAPCSPDPGTIRIRGVGSRADRHMAIHSGRNATEL